MFQYSNYIVSTHSLRVHFKTDHSCELGKLELELVLRIHPSFHIVHEYVKGETTESSEGIFDVRILKSSNHSF
jgi:hypothetical protein